MRVVKIALLTVAFMASFFSRCAAVDQDITENRLPKNAIDALSIGKDVILYSLDPGPGPFSPPPPFGPEGGLNGFKILGHVSLTDPKQRSVAVDALNAAIHAADFRLMANCFFPRHAIRVTADGTSFDFMLCYQCRQMQLFEKGVLKAVIGIPDAPDPLKKLLTEAKIPVAKVWEIPTTNR
jgi:hypothetical protein